MVRRDLTDAPDNAICLFVNPEILEKDKKSKTLVREGCMSFPHKAEIARYRYGRVKVGYDQINEKGEFIHKEEWVENLIAQIFQHECDHAKGVTIY